MFKSMGVTLCLLGTKEEEEVTISRYRILHLPGTASPQPSIRLRTGHSISLEFFILLSQSEPKSLCSVNCSQRSLYHRTKAENHVQLASDGAENEAALLALHPGCVKRQRGRSTTLEGWRWCEVRGPSSTASALVCKSLATEKC